MKKILALVLALVLVTVCASALAKSSKNNNDIPSGETDNPDLTLEKIEDTEEIKEIKQKITDAQENEGDPTKGLPEDIQAKLPEGFRTINEMDSYKLTGELGTQDPVTITFKFETPYKEGQKVMVVIAIVPEDAEAEWLAWEGTGNADGDVECVVPLAEATKIYNNPFVAIPVSE